MYVPGHGKNVVDGINATDNFYLKEKMELIVKLAFNDTSNIGMRTSASNDVSIKFLYQCIHTINNKEIINGLRGSTKTKKK